MVDVKEPKRYYKLGEKTDNLVAGDYLIEGCRGKVVIERKMVSDLISSLHGKDKGTGDNRFWNQVKMIASMKDEGFIPYVVIVGDTWYALKNGYLSISEWWNTQLSIQKFGVGVAVCKNMDEFKSLVDCWDVNLGNANYEYVRPTVRKGTRTIAEERQDMISSVNGIGMKTAVTVVSLCDTLKGIMQMLERDDKELLIVLGKERAQHLKEVLMGDKSL